VWVECPAYRGQLLDLPVQRGVCRLLADVAFRKQHPVRQHVVVRWERGLPTRRDEPWFLMSNLRRPALALSQLYSQRMTIEELFRDDKNRRNGWALRDTKLRRAGREGPGLVVLGHGRPLAGGPGV